MTIGLGPLALDTGELPSPTRPTPVTLLCAQFRFVALVEQLQGAAADVLASWCHDGAASSLLVLVGPAGVGKTRLLIELGRRLRAEGWDAGFLAPLAAASPLPPRSRPTLTILDYADVEPSLRERVAQLARSGPDGPPLRVVLVARALGEWWHALAEDRRLAVLLPDAPIVRLGDEAINPALAARLQRGAADQFATALGRPAPTRLAPLPPTLGALGILSAALCQVLGASRVDEPFAAILDHEEKLWSAAMRHRLASDRLRQRFLRFARLSTAALVLHGGATDPDSVRRLLMRLGGSEYAEFADVLRELYPGPTDGAIRPLEPDLLGETLVMRTLQRYPAELERLLTDLDDFAVEHVPHVLLRVAQRGGAEPTRWLTRVLHHDLGSFAPATATAVLAASPDPVALVWAAALTGALTGFDGSEPADDAAPSKLVGDPELAGRMLERIPQHTLALVVAGAWAAVVLARALPPIDNPAWEYQRAFTYGVAAHFLQRIGAHEAALLFSRAKAALLRGRPDDRDLLTNCLRNQAILYQQLGLRVAALDVFDECVAICRARLTEDPAAPIRSELAACLDHRGIILAHIGETARAVASTEESVTLYRALSDEHSGHYRRDLAAALDNLGGRYREAGDQVRSLAVTEEALTIYRALAESTPDEVLVDLLICLNTTACRRLRCGDAAGAGAAIDDALVRLRPLADHHPELAKQWVSTLINAVQIHRALGHDADAERDAEELRAALEREGTQGSHHAVVASPDGRTHDLATPGGRNDSPETFEIPPHQRASELDERSRVLMQIGAADEALRAAESALAALPPVPGDRDVAAHRMVLRNNLANRQADAGAYAEARATTAEVLAEAERLAAAGDADGRAMLAMARANLAVRYCELGTHADGIPLAEAAVAELTARVDDPAAAVDLPRALGILSRCREGVGDAEGAARAMAEADRVHAARVERELGALELPARLDSDAWRTHLHALLADQFTPESLRAWLGERPGGAALLTGLPLAPCSLDVLVTATIAALERHGAFDPAWFMALHVRLPRCKLRIAILHALWDSDTT